MAAVNWNKPSKGLVNDALPSLRLANSQGNGLDISANEVGVDSLSKKAEAFRGQTQTTITARFASDQGSAVVALAPQQFAVAGMNRDELPAVLGVSGTDPKLPPYDQLGGIGVAGITDRAAATGVLGAAIRGRSTGVLGRAELGTGVRGEGGTGPGVVGVSGQSNAIEGNATGPAAAGLWASSQAGPGVKAQAVAFPGLVAESAQAEGVVGEAKVANAAGLRGFNNGAGGIGVAGAAQNGIGVSASASAGVCLDAFTFNADGIHVNTINGIGIDVSSFTNTAVKALSGTGAAVHAGAATSPAVDAVGLTTGVNAGAIGGADPNDLKKGCGVCGTSLSHAGVCGVSVTGAGVLGISPPQLGWAGRFRGNVLVEGVLSKFASFFSIDHPLDPETKLLQHAAIEAPELKTFYDGIATLDRSGRARVRLPRWFGALNAAIRYQLTPIGSAAPELHVASEIRANAFVIAGGRPGQRVSWQLTGVRQDRWAKANPLVVECPKTPARRIRPVSKQAMDTLERELRQEAASVASRAQQAKSNRQRKRILNQGSARPAPGGPAPARGEAPKVMDAATALRKVRALVGKTRTKRPTR